ncbi:MAG: molybdopterin-dependent oxidoreductase [Erysipelotrichaceae bacterium]|nr:molybdopterin-dependent oxidoreductase [Erysipelotrichaceae bacterium]
MSKIKFGILFGLLCIGLSGCGTFDNGVDVHSQATLSRFRENEVTEYQGKFLDPSIGPEDNSISGVQHLNITTYRLKITGLITEEIILTYDEVLALETHQRLITLHCVTGWDATILWEGILLSDLIALAHPGVDVTTIIFHASDGYTTSLPYSVIKDKQLILAYKSNGLTLPDELGYPFIVVAEEKYGYKWARWVTEIELSSDSNYKGYWEKFGYDNIADVD